MKKSPLDEVKREVVRPEGKLFDESPVLVVLVCATELDDGGDGDAVDVPVLEIVGLIVVLKPELDGLMVIEVPEANVVEFDLNDAVMKDELL